MKASEALRILNKLAPDHEVTLDIGAVPKREITYPHVPMYQDKLKWVIEKEFWPKRTEITCKLH